MRGCWSLTNMTVLQSNQQQGSWGSNHGHTEMSSSGTAELAVQCEAHPGGSEPSKAHSQTCKSTEPQKAELLSTCSQNAILFVSSQARAMQQTLLENQQQMRHQQDLKEAESLAAELAAQAERRHYLLSTRSIPGRRRLRSHFPDCLQQHSDPAGRRHVAPAMADAATGAAAAVPHAPAARRETRLQQIPSAAAAAAREEAQKRHLQPRKVLDIEVDSLLKRPQRALEALPPLAAARGTAAAVIELRQANQDLCGSGSRKTLPL
ncbi:uncharacterized protein LOC113146675 [Cyclospora cayetanensis]|uniref:Uncharacterized protein LOC113146675 n=1 Tax=Cyclospora cayetanensis TaxID=88456 RepID=A0A6P6RTU5_9EIME|nr:uncharacterized protein LOC113146675 [Cyclospora cayetanensis]